MAQPCDWVTQECQGVVVEGGGGSIHAGGHVTLCNGRLHNDCTARWIDKKAEISVDDNHYDSPMRST